MRRDWDGMGWAGLGWCASRSAPPALGESSAGLIIINSLETGVQGDCAWWCELVQLCLLRLELAVEDCLSLLPCARCQRVMIVYDKRKALMVCGFDFFDAASTVIPPSISTRSSLSGIIQWELVQSKVGGAAITMPSGPRSAHLGARL